MEKVGPAVILKIGNHYDLATFHIIEKTSLRAVTLSHVAQLSIRYTSTTSEHKFQKKVISCAARLSKNLSRTFRTVKVFMREATKQMIAFYGIY